jgi:hypothetical protein
LRGIGSLLTGPRFARLPVTLQLLRCFRLSGRRVPPAAFPVKGKRRNCRCLRARIGEAGRPLRHLAGVSDAHCVLNCPGLPLRARPLLRVPSHYRWPPGPVKGRRQTHIRPPRTLLSGPPATKPFPAPTRRARENSPAR